MPENGDRIGPYRIIDLLGAGGMGEVFLAEDSRLQRRVALKILPAALADDDLARRRLLREAQSAATLDHPNICTVYEAGEADGRGFIAMQYIEGETLAARLMRSAPGPEAAVRIATDVARALVEAHSRGTVHRDIKPQNIMITRSGQAKVLDFGLAKALSSSHSDVETTVTLSEAGTVHGTVPYMSPEQARGEALDERSDIFSLGVVMYEAIAGRHPFQRSSRAETTSLVLMGEPPPLDAKVPAEIRRIIQKCLEKDRGRRYQTARDLVVDLDAVTRGATRRPEPAARRHRAWIAAGVLVPLAGVVAWWLASRAPSPSVAPELLQVTAFADAASAPVLSPDGRMVAFIRDSGAFLVQGEVYVKLLPNGEALRLTGDSRIKCCLAFSPDGSRLAFTVLEQMATREWNTYTVPVLGGPASRLLPNATGLTWIDDRRVLFSEIKGSGLHMGLVTATEARQEYREIYFPEHERAMVHYSALSPDQRSVLIVEMNRTGGWDRCRLLPFDGSSRGTLVGPDGPCTSVAWSPDGRWMYFSSTTGGASHLWRQRFPNGEPTPLTSSPATDEQGVTVAPDGSIVTSIGRRATALWLHDERGDHPVPSEGIASRPEFSADGKHVYFLLQRDAASPTQEFVRVNLDTGRPERLLPDVPVLQYDVSRDDTEVVFTTPGTSGDGQIWIAALDRRSAPRLLRDANGVFFGAGQEIVFRTLEGRANFLDRMNRDGTGYARVWKSPIMDLISVSADGHWAIARVVNNSVLQLVESIAIPLAGGGAPRPVCEGVCAADWSPDGRSFAFAISRGMGSGQTLLIQLAAGQMFPPVPTDGATTPAAWAKLPGVRSVNRYGVVPSRDGKTYVYTKNDDARNLFRIPIR